MGEPLLFLHKAMEGLEGQVQSIVSEYFPIIIKYQQLVIV